MLSFTYWHAMLAFLMRFFNSCTKEGTMPKRANSPESSESGSPTKKKKETANADLGEKENTFLAKMMEHRMGGREAVTYEQLRVELGIGNRTASQLKAWKTLQNEGYIEAATGKNEFKLTEKGVDYASTPEYKEMIKELNIVSATNEDHQEKIKKYLTKFPKRGGEIIDLLIKHGSLTALELAALMKLKRNSHSFSDALKELKEKGYVEVDTAPARKVKGKMIRLADKAFLSPADRKPEEILHLETDALEQAVKDNAERKRGPPKEKKEKKQKKEKEDSKGPANDAKTKIVKEEKADTNQKIPSGAKKVATGEASAHTSSKVKEELEGTCEDVVLCDQSQSVLIEE